MVRSKLILPILVAMYSAPAAADDVMAAAFLDWAKREDMAPAAIITLDPAGHVQTQAAIGMDVTTPMPIASISKTIAGQCALHLARSGIISMDDPIGTALGWSGPQGAVTYGALLTHTSNFGPDATQGDFRGRLLRNETGIARLVADIATRALTDRQSDHSYNNENYLVLETALNAVLGGSAFDWCRRNVPELASLQSLGRADQMRAIGFAGGLDISTRDLATFFHNLSSPQPDWPMVQLDSTNSYGPGLIVQSTDKGHNLFHIGGVCTVFGPNLGAFGAQLANGASIAVTYSGCADSHDLTFLNSFALELLEGP